MIELQNAEQARPGHVETIALMGQAFHALGAYDKALANIAAGGLSDEADKASGTSGFDALAPEILRYDYSFGAFAVAASLRQPVHPIH